MSFRNPIPSSVSVGEYPVRVWYAGQPVVCTICHESGHLTRACPFSGLCLRCKQPGHVARKCTQPWGPPSTVPAPVPVLSAPVSMSVPSSAPSSVLTSVLSSTVLPTPVSSVLTSAPVVSDVFLEDGEIAESAEALSSVPATVQSTPVPVPSPSPSTCVPVSVPSCSAASDIDDVPLRTSNLPALVPATRPPVSSRPPRVSSVDYKRLIRLVFPKVKLDSDSSAVKKQCLALVKTHKLNVSDDDCARIASAVCSGDTPRVLAHVFPEDYVPQVKSMLLNELPKVPAAQFLEPAVYTRKFLSTHSVPARFHDIVLAQTRAYIEKTRKK